MRISLPVVLLFAALAFGPAEAATTFSVPDSALPDPLVLIAYGDMRFTSPEETTACSPTARQALVARIAQENPAAVFISGDLPWHGVATDYKVYRSETRAWRKKHLRIYPALGNHEFSQCLEPSCLELWWKSFPQLRGRRWYSVAIGSKVVAISLDSDTALDPGSEQGAWLEQQVAALGSAVRMVLIVMHHPPVADVQTVKLVDHNPRPNEEALVPFLRMAAANSAARFVVSAGHIHNYERNAQDGVMFLVSGGGGAKPYEVDRTQPDLYQATDFPNFHYVRFELQAGTLKGEMIRLEDYDAAKPAQWRTRDRFEITLRP
jgi:acid phosphatase type 7